MRACVCVCARASACVCLCVRGCRCNVCACAPVNVCCVSVRAHQPCLHGCGMCAWARAGDPACAVRLDCVSECARNQPALALRAPCVSTQSTPSGPSERAGDVPARARPLRTGPPQTKTPNKQTNKQTLQRNKHSKETNKRTKKQTNKQTPASARRGGQPALERQGAFVPFRARGLGRRGLRRSA